jgi:hypothetical protein
MVFPIVYSSCNCTLEVDSHTSAGWTRANHYSVIEFGSLRQCGVFLGCLLENHVRS